MICVAGQLREAYVYADVAELVDALASGASVLRDVEVQVLSSVPKVKDGSFDPSFTFDVLYE